MAEKKTKQKKVYINDLEGKPLLSTISSGCKTPVLDVKWCNLKNPFYYPNSPKVPRYSITCFLDVDIPEEQEFFDNVRAIEKNEKVDSIIKRDTVHTNDGTQYSGKFLIKFQTKDIIPVYLGLNEEEEQDQIELEDDLAQNEKVVVVFEIIRYTKKGNTLDTVHGLSFKPTAVHYFPKTSKKKA